MSITVTLRVANGPSSGKQAMLDHAHFVVGRSSCADLVIDDPQVSLDDFELTVEGDQIHLDNLAGRLMVNGRRVERAMLHDHDRIGVGETEIQVRVARALPPRRQPPETGVGVTLPLCVVPATAVTAPLPPAPARGEGQVALADVQLFHLGDTAYDSPPVGRRDFPDPPRTGAGVMCFRKNAAFALKNPYGLLYGLVDAARDFNLACQARRLGYEPVSLFLGDQAVQLADLAPYFIQLPHGVPFLTNEWRAAVGHSCGVLIDSPASPAAVFAHLRSVFIAKDEAGQEYFFRYYDPRVLRPYLPSCTAEQLAEFFGPVRAWICEDEAGQGYLAFSRGQDGKLVREELGLIEVESPS